MTSVDVEIGGTFPFPGEKNFGNVKVLVRIAEVNLDEDVDEQLARAETAVVKIVAKVDGLVAAEVQDAMLEQAGPAVTEKLAKQLATNSENIKRIAEQVKKLLPPVGVAVKEKRGQVKADG